MFSLTFTSASSFGYNYLDQEQDSITDGGNYSINVNNTEHLQGRDTNQLYSYFESLFNSVYCKLTGCTISGNITADYFVGDGSQLTGITDNYFNTTHLSNFTDDLGNRGYSHLSNFTDDLEDIYFNTTHLSNFTDDLGYFNTISYKNLSEFNESFSYNTTISATNPTFTYNTSDTNLVSFWAFNTSTPEDLSPNGYDLISYGTTYNGSCSANNVGGDINGCYSFNGSDYLYTESGSNIVNLEDEFTITMWVNPSSVTGDKTLISKYDTGDARSWRLYTYDGDLGLGVGDPNDGSFEGARITPGAVVSVGSWQFVTVTFNAGTIKFYTNNVSRSHIVASGTIPSSLYNPAIPVLLGGLYLTGTPGLLYNGEMDEIRIYDRELSNAEIGNLYEFGNYHNYTIEASEEQNVTITTNQTFNFSDTVVYAKDFIVESRLYDNSAYSDLEKIKIKPSNDSGFSDIDYADTGLRGSLGFGFILKALKEINNNMKLHNNLTEFDSSIMAEKIYTQSKVINLVTNYAIKFLDRDSLSDKATHKNKDIVLLDNGDTEKVLDMEGRVVDLEGAFANHMTCMYNNKKYDDYQECMLE